MPRKSATSATTADPTGDVSMVSEAPTVPSPKQTKDQQRDGSKPTTSTPSSSKKKEKDTQDKPHSHQQGDAISLDDLLLPRSIIQRLAKGVLPPNTSLQRDAVLALTKSATVFISLLASTANELTERKTVQSPDVLKALREIEMEGFVGREGRVEREVEIWEKEVRGKRKGYRDRVKARESAGGAGDTTMGDTTVGSVDVLQREGEGEGEGEEHESKRVRIDLDAEAAGRDGSTGPITQETARIKLNGNGAGSGQKVDEVEMEDGDDVEEEEDSDQDEESDEGEDEEQDEADETRGTIEDSIDVDEDEASRRRKNGTLAPDGRVEVGGSDDDDDSD